MPSESMIVQARPLADKGAVNVMGPLPHELWRCHINFIDLEARHAELKGSCCFAARSFQWNLSMRPLDSLHQKFMTLRALSASREHLLEHSGPVYWQAGPSEQAYTLKSSYLLVPTPSLHWRYKGKGEGGAGH